MLGIVVHVSFQNKIVLCANAPLNVQFSLKIPDTPYLPPEFYGNKRYQWHSLCFSRAHVIFFFQGVGYLVLLGKHIRLSMLMLEQFAV
jgi:hypothetical protein